MQQNPNYTLVCLADTAFLLPYGQLIASHKRGIQLNETGTVIWNLLKNPMDLPTLVELTAHEFGIPQSEREDFQKDIEHFVSELSALEILIDTPAPDEPAFCYLQIAGLTLKLCGPQEAFSKEFDLFKVPQSEEIMADADTDQIISVTEEAPPLRENGQYLLRNPQLCIYETLNHYILLFPLSKQILEAHLGKDGRRAVFYCQPPYDQTFIYDLFHAIRLPFLYLAGQHSMYAIHSASICYRDKAWLFSGRSGIGKSTHTNLWKEQFATPVINGDLNLLAVKNGKPVIFGIPWCGTSEICDTHTYSLGGITFLKQETGNRMIPQSDGQFRLAILQRLISPLWTEEMMQKAAAFINQISCDIFLGSLGCTVSPEAACVIKKAIDEHCSKN